MQLLLLPVGAHSLLSCSHLRVSRGRPRIGFKELCNELPAFFTWQIRTNVVHFLSTASSSFSFSFSAESISWSAHLWAEQFQVKKKKKKKKVEELTASRSVTTVNSLNDDHDDATLFYLARLLVAIALFCEQNQPSPLDWYTSLFTCCSWCDQRANMTQHNEEQVKGFTCLRIIIKEPSPVPSCRLVKACFLTRTVDG